jgi:glucose dehydrogenase
MRDNTRARIDFGFEPSSITASGLIFIDATSDGMLRGIHHREGDVLWERALTYPVRQPMSFQAADGRQALGVLQRRRAQQQAARASRRRPLASGFPEFGMLSDPANVGFAARRLDMDG